MGGPGAGLRERARMQNGGPTAAPFVGRARVAARTNRSRRKEAEDGARVERGRAAFLCSALLAGSCFINRSVTILSILSFFTTTAATNNNNILKTDAISMAG